MLKSYRDYGEIIQRMRAVIPSLITKYVSKWWENCSFCNVNTFT